MIVFSTTERSYTESYMDGRKIGFRYESVCRDKEG